MVAIGWTEALIVIAIIAIFFFGKDKLLDWAKSIGQAKQAYKEGAEEKKTSSKKKKKK